MAVFPRNFKTLGQTQAELHSLKVENLEVCIRLLFANSVTYYNYDGCSYCTPERSSNSYTEKVAVVAIAGCYIAIDT